MIYFDNVKQGVVGSCTGSADDAAAAAIAVRPNVRRWPMLTKVVAAPVRVTSSLSFIYTDLEYLTIDT